MDDPDDLVEGGTGYGSSSRWVGVAVAAVETFADWMAPKSAWPRRVKVPNLCGLHVDDAFHEAALAGVKTDFVPVATRPAAVEGIVVAQDPMAGTKVRRDSLVLLTVQHKKPS